LPMEAPRHMFTHCPMARDSGEVTTHGRDERDIDPLV